MDSSLNSDSIPFTVHVFKEGGVFVAHVPELDVSSCGDTADKARQNIQIAVQGYLLTAEEKGTLNEIMEEAGYRSSGDGWLAPEFVSLDHLTVSLR